MVDPILTGHYDSADAISRSDQIFAMITSDLDEYNRSEGVSEWIGVYTVNEFEKTKKIIRQATKEMKAAGEAGDPEAQRGRRVEMEFLSKSYDVRTEFTEDFMEDASDAELIDETLQALTSDKRLQNKLFFIELLRRPTTNTSSGVTGFYYGQTDVPNFQGITHFNSAHDHYLTTASNTVWASGDFPVGRNHITHHGYGETDGGIVFLANSVEMTLIAALTEFSDLGITKEQEVNGIIGKIRGVLLKEENWIPNAYGIFLPATPAGVIVYKQHFKESERGLQLKPGSNPADPLIGARYKRVKVGMNTVLKGAGVVMYKGASWTQDTSLSTR